MTSAPINYWKESITQRRGFLEQQRKQFEQAVIELQTAEDKLAVEEEACKAFLKIDQARMRPESAKLRRRDEEEDYETEEDQEDEAQQEEQERPKQAREPPRPTPMEERRSIRETLRNWGKPKPSV